MREKSTSRREFFTDLGGAVLEQVSETVAPLFPKQTPGSGIPKSQINNELCLGSIADLAVGTEKHFHDFGVCLQSLPRGIRVLELRTGRAYALRLDRLGKVWMNRSLEWEPIAVLCLMTGEKRIV